jgi:VWFA-related protein
LAAGYLSAQTTPEQPTFRTGANAVVVDLIVTDKQGRPVHDLKPQDFTVLEDGKPQAIVSFRERRADAPPLPAQNIAAHLLPNEYTNLVERAEPGALTVILLTRSTRTSRTWRTRAPSWSAS